MRQINSDQLADFAAIYDEDVELVSVSRPRSELHTSVARHLIQSRQVASLRWVQDADDPQASDAALPKSLDPEVRAALMGEICAASEMVAELIECEQIGIRLETLSKPMCPRFHVDHVPCRLLITLDGAGTEWIRNPEVDWDVFANLETTAPPVAEGGQIQHLATGDWSLLKGGAWHDGFDGVVHRSPHDAGERLLLSLDPMA